MNTKLLLKSFLILVGLFVAGSGAYALGHLMPDPVLPANPGQPPLDELNLPSRTQNGYTASVKSYYADALRLVFVVQVTGGEGDIGNVVLTDEKGEFINASTGYGPVTNSDPSLSQIEFDTVVPLPGDRLKGRLAFSYLSSPGNMKTLADFSFDLDLPIASGRVVSPKGTVSANGVEILLDRIIVTPAYTQVYLCYSKPSEADWATSMESTITVDGKRSSSNDYALLFDPAIADGSKGGDPGWTPPVKDRRCVKLGFPVGDSDPHVLALNIPALERSRPDFIPQADLDAAYAKLRVQGIDMEWHAFDHGAYPEFHRLPFGMTEQDAMRRFEEALGNTYKGPWEISVSLNP